MSSPLPPVPHNTPLIEQYSLMLHPVWADWFIKVFQRVGGYIADTNDELYSVNTLRIEDAAVTSAKLAAAVAGAGLIGGAGSALAVNPDNTTVEVVGDAVQLKDGAVTAAKIAAGVIAFAKFLATDWINGTGASGYQKLPSGLYIQWGVTGSLASATTTTISFPVAFPTACRQVIPGIQGNSAGATAATGQWGSGNYTTTGFDLYNRTSATYTFNYLAVGL